jgi:hypothetical protein
MLSTSYKILFKILLSRLSRYIDKIIQVISVGFDAIDQPLVRLFAFVRYWRKNVLQ